MAKRVQEFLIKENLKLNSEICILELHTSDPLPEILPGQFTQVRIDGNSNVFLRRPFSFHDVDYKNNTVKLLVQVIGNGTKQLYYMTEGTNLNLLYPLGNSFTIPAKKERVLLVGGGSGIAPLLLLAKKLNEKNIQPDILLGFRNKGRITGKKEFEKFGKLLLTTEDGSEGEKGYVTDHSVLKTSTFDSIYCCGPDPMMKAVASYARKHEINCEVSLENLMGCGIGICLCCIAPTNSGNICTCTDGPVFNIKNLKW